MTAKGKKGTMTQKINIPRPARGGGHGDENFLHAWIDYVLINDVFKQNQSQCFVMFIAYFTSGLKSIFFMLTERIRQARDIALQRKDYRHS